MKYNQLIIKSYSNSKKKIFFLFQAPIYFSQQYFGWTNLKQIKTIQNIFYINFEHLTCNSWNVKTYTTETINKAEMYTTKIKTSVSAHRNVFVLCNKKKIQIVWRKE